ncbi:MAG: ABC transporter permease subunit, partial [Bdellovibrionales bacterium]|nr:ABC transporter permease subunit [Bdellovibrionales bacterium]
MRVVWIIALNTFREIIRDRILYGLVVFALLLIGLSLALGQLSFAEQIRISANFGFTGIHLSAVMLSIFAGGSLVAKEIDKKTILTLLARPISRFQFMLGKSLGLTLVVVSVVTGLALVLAFILMNMGFKLNEGFFLGLFGI